MENSYTVIVSDRAKQMLATHLKFVATVNKDAARTTKKRIVEGIASLGAFPARYPFFNEPNISPNKYHKMYIESWYLVLSQIRDTTVFVDYVIDCRQDYGWLVR